MSVDHRRGDSGCPCRAPWTGRTWSFGIGGFPWAVFHSWYGVSIVTKSGAFGGGASAKALLTSAPYTLKLLSAAATQKMRAPVCSRLAA